MDRIKELQLVDLRQACREVRQALREKQENNRYPKEWNADIDAVIDILGDQIDGLSDMLAKKRRGQ